MGQYSGHVIGAVRDAIRDGFLQWSPRIMLAIYNVDIQASSTVTAIALLISSGGSREGIRRRHKTAWSHYR